MELGDRIGVALERIGVTEERVEKWLGKPCGCARRRRKLNNLDRWARDQVGLTIEAARKRIARMIGRI